MSRKSLAQTFFNGTIGYEGCVQRMHSCFSLWVDMNSDRLQKQDSATTLHNSQGEV